MAEEKASPKKDDGGKGRGYIRYLGASQVRGLTVQDFERIGVTDQKEDVWWRRENRWVVSRADLTDAAYNLAVRNDPELVLIGGDEDEGAVAEEQMGDRAPMAAGMTPMPQGPSGPGDYVGGGSISGGSSGQSGSGGSSSGSTSAR